jgi:hypothetical protein
VSYLPKLVLAPSVEKEPRWNVGAASEVWREHKGRVSAYGFSMDGRHSIHVPRVATFYFNRGAQEVTAVAVPGVSSDRIEDAYRRIGLPLALQALGTEVLHASAVLTPGGVVAFCAVSGVGKSTIAFALSRRGYTHWADDSVAMDASGPRIRAIPIPFRVRLKNEAAEYFRAELESVPQDTLAFCADSEPLLALVLLQRAVEQDRPNVEIVPVTPSAAFPALLEHAHCFSLMDPDRKRKMMSTYLEITNRIPVYEMRFQSGLEKTQKILNELEKVITSIAQTAS